VANNQYLIEYSDFKGPANLLLDLIRKKKVDIYQVRLSSIINDFLEYVKENKEILLDTLSSFLYIATILLEIKANSIIPSQNKILPDEEESLDGEILQYREQQYMIYKKISHYIAKLKELEALYFIRESPVEVQFIAMLPDFLKNLNIENINNLASVLLMKRDFHIDFSEIYLEDSTTTIIDEMKRIQVLIVEKKEVTFAEIAEKYTFLIDKIICFLSILELYKNEFIDIIQFENFGNIIIKKTGEGKEDVFLLYER